MQIDSFQDLFGKLISLIGREQAYAVLRSLALWGIAGGALGLVLSLGCYRVFRRLRWYWATSPAGRWLQRGVLLLVTLASMTLTGLMGVLESVRRQTPAIVTRITASSGLHDLVGFLSDGLFELDLAVQAKIAGARPAENLLREFRAGQRELDVPALLQRIDGLSDEFLRELLDAMEDRMLGALPDLGQGRIAKTVRQSTRAFGTALLKREVASAARDRHLDHLYHAVRQQLLAEAARSGHPSTIGRADLSAFLVREGIIPAVVTPAQQLARQQQWYFGLLALACWLAPPPLFRLFQPREAPATASGAGAP